MRTEVVVVPLELEGERADKVLAEMLELPRSAVRKIIDDSGATVEGSPIKPSQKLSEGVVVTVGIPEPVVDLTPERDVPFNVLYEDSSVIVIDKPAGVVVHPGSGRGSGTLVNGLISRFPELVGVGQQDRWGIVHRLDRDTSGLLVVARREDAYDSLIEMMKAREVSRRYLSVVLGGFANTIGTIDAPIGRDPKNPTRMHLNMAGREAVTHYRRLAGWGSGDRSTRKATLLSVTLETGRTHQIRVHMGSIGHPILGDRTYGRCGVTGDPGRTWLHARELGFNHPGTGEKLSFISELPNDLSSTFGLLGEPDHGELRDVNGELLVI